MFIVVKVVNDEGIVTKQALIYEIKHTFRLIRAHVVTRVCFKHFLLYVNNIMKLCTLGILTTNIRFECPIVCLSIQENGKIVQCVHVSHQSI